MTSVSPDGWAVLETMLKQMRRRIDVGDAATPLWFSRLDEVSLPAPLRELLRSYPHAASRLDAASDFEIVDQVFSKQRAYQVRCERPDGPTRLVSLAEDQAVLDERAIAYVPQNEDGSLDNDADRYYCFEEADGHEAVLAARVPFAEYLAWRWLRACLSASFDAAAVLSARWPHNKPSLVERVSQLLGVDHRKAVELTRLTTNFGADAAWGTSVSELPGRCVVMVGGTQSQIALVKEVLDDASREYRRAKHGS